MNLRSIFYNTLTFLRPSVREQGWIYSFCEPSQDGGRNLPTRGQSIQLIMECTSDTFLVRYPDYRLWLKIGSEQLYFDENNRLHATHPLARPEWFLISARMDNATAHRLLDLWNTDIDNALTSLAAHMRQRDFIALERFVQTQSRLVP